MQNILEVSDKHCCKKVIWRGGSRRALDESHRKLSVSSLAVQRRSHHLHSPQSNSPTCNLISRELQLHKAPF